MLRTLIQLNKHTLPEKYFIDRWRPVERKQVRNATTFIPTELTGSNCTLRYNLLSKCFVDVASESCLNLERTNYMVAELQRIKSELRKIPVTEENENIINDSRQEMNTNLTSEIDSYTNNEDPHQITDKHTSTSLICNGTRSTTDYEVPTLIVQQKDFPDSGKDTDLFKNPDVVPRKGRPKTMQKSRRLVPYGEIVRTKSK